MRERTWGKKGGESGRRSKKDTELRKGCSQENGTFMSEVEKKEKAVPNAEDKGIGFWARKKEKELLPRKGKGIEMGRSRRRKGGGGGYLKEGAALEEKVVGVQLSSSRGMTSEEKGEEKFPTRGE